jgi:sec-independent protein translocase protein TatA
MFDVGSGELVLIMIVALLLFGKRLPEVARGLGRSVAELKRGLSDTARPLREAELDLRREIEETGKGGPGPS